jgi:hypothetical protein
MPASREAETAADRRLYLEIGLSPVTCAQCGTEVLVKKNSDKHTSVQWTNDAATVCPEIAAQVAIGTTPGQVLGCSALKASIAEAVRSGAVTVPDD